MTLCNGMNHYCFLVLVLSVYIIYDVHCYSTSGNLREILIDCFQKALMKDSEQIFMLQKAFLLPEQIGGRCLTIDVTVQGRIDLTSDPDYFYYCDEHLKENNSCVYNSHITSYFELSPAPVTTLVEFLGSNSIVQALAAMDPSFHTLITVTVISTEFASNIDIDYYPPYNSYEIYMACTVGNIDPSQIIYDDVIGAVYITLSWVSYNIIHDNNVYYINYAGKGLY